MNWKVRVVPMNEHRPEHGSHIFVLDEDNNMICDTAALGPDAERIAYLIAASPAMAKHLRKLDGVLQEVYPDGNGGRFQASDAMELLSPFIEEVPALVDQAEGRGPRAAVPDIIYAWAQPGGDPDRDNRWETPEQAPCSKPRGERYIRGTVYDRAIETLEEAKDIVDHFTSGEEDDPDGGVKEANYVMQEIEAVLEADRSVKRRLLKLKE